MLLPILIHVHNYTKINALDLGKITSLPNSENVFNLHASFQSSPKKKDTATTDDDLRLDEPCALFVALG